LAKKFRLDIAATLAQLSEIRAFVGDCAAELGLEEPAIEDLKVCVDEAATNIVKHGYRNEKGRLSVEVYREANEIAVRITDHAPPFDPEAAPPPELDLPLRERPVGGMGVHLIKTLTDGLTRRVGPNGGNELVLRKKVAGAE